ncbi:MAG TPA: LEPR-XLL domain-containing protein, partial [Tepidisphaeraceae bacterium]|nr:LEPR-XLL domain-containing protein [Tepidisphaeraceae bacterium]
MKSSRKKFRPSRGACADQLEQRMLLSAGLLTTDQDIGSPALAGSSTYDMPSDTYTVSAGGSGIGGTADQFNFDYSAMT